MQALDANRIRINDQWRGCVVWTGSNATHNGKGVSEDENLGIMWTAKAAARGHVIVQAQMKGLINRALDRHPDFELDTPTLYQAHHPAMAGSEARR